MQKLCAFLWFGYITTSIYFYPAVETYKVNFVTFFSTYMYFILRVRHLLLNF